MYSLKWVIARYLSYSVTKEINTNEQKSSLRFDRHHHVYAFNLHLNTTLSKSFNNRPIWY